MRCWHGKHGNLAPTPLPKTKYWSSAAILSHLTGFSDSQAFLLLDVVFGLVTSDNHLQSVN
jgi:hypothetical protein